MKLKKLSIILISIIIILVAGFFALRSIAISYYTRKSGPPRSFDQTEVPPEPDYSQSANWAALPEKFDFADTVPEADPVDNQKTAAVDAFYVHPTSYLMGDLWNQSMEDEKINTATDLIIMVQASAFNNTCKVYAPRYRQGIIHSFYDMEGEGKKALDLAYQDVKRAFEYYMKNYNNDRPFILVSHSQGTEHTVRLLKESITGKDIRKKLIAAYLIGREIKRETLAWFPDIPVCNSPDQLGCLITWNTQGPEPKFSLVTQADSVCVNPLTWKSDSEHADKSLNLGGVRYPKSAGKPLQVDLGVCDAMCVNGALQITPPTVPGYDNMVVGKDNYHIYDFPLFYMNIRKNAANRVNAYLRKNQMSLLVN